MNFKVNLFFHLYETHITPLGIPIPTVPRVSDGVRLTYKVLFADTQLITSQLMVTFINIPLDQKS